MCVKMLFAQFSICLYFIHSHIFVIHCAIDPDSYPNKQVDLHNFYSLEMLQTMLQCLIDKSDQKNNFESGTPGRENRKLIRIESASIKQMARNGDLINATIYMGERSCDLNSGAGPTVEEVVSFIIE
uniref:Uncharacterized protein n=1 Tax=Romanomermis culicivorax TaxID=13658 RepID=A0A915INT1_ROMCU